MCVDVLVWVGGIGVQFTSELHVNERTGELLGSPFRGYSRSAYTPIVTMR